jgi:mannan endo-1,4-beta-mannosidase
MKRIYIIVILLIGLFLLFYLSRQKQEGCYIGAFLADKPTKADIEGFAREYGRSPAIVMVYIDWGHFVDDRIIKDVYSNGAILCITWEPWDGYLKKPINYEEILTGHWDDYIAAFAEKIKSINGTVLLIFAHEPNGDWYPWSGTKIGSQQYVGMYRRVKNIFKSKSVDNVLWVFGINYEDAPRENNRFSLYYPGDKYVDCVSIDGYNWGSAQKGGKWLSFKEIFMPIYKEVCHTIKKPIIIGEFSSSSYGGDKAKWIKDAMQAIKIMKRVKAFILFNADKEADWSFSTDTEWGKQLKKELQNKYFKDSNFKLK